MCKSEILFSYDKNIVPLLQWMTNLEQLALYIFSVKRTFIDRNCLKNDIINHLPRLSKFIFNIPSYIYNLDQTHLLSNEYIQHTLADLTDVQVVSYVDYFPWEGSGQCHFYSYPYTLRYYDNITNSFQGGLFKCVRNVSLFDERPFEHEFLLELLVRFRFLKNYL